MPLAFDPSDKFTTGLLIGDLHIRKEEIAEAAKFIKWITSSVVDLNKRLGTRVLPVFMGDQYNDFGIKQIEVEAFWQWAYSYMYANLGYPTASDTGNHDMNQTETANSMSVHNDFTIVVGKQPVIIPNTNVGMVGFIRKEEDFYTAVMSLYAAGVRKVLCHAEFNGAQYENGFYSPHGFDLSRYPSDLRFYSGHIHLKQEFGNVMFTGTPRHITKSDIGEIKGVFLMDFMTGATSFQPTPEDVFSPFVLATINEATFTPDQLKTVEDMVSKSSSPSKVYVEIVGTKEFVKKIENKLPGGVKPRSIYTDEARTVVVKESEGIPATFSKFSDQFFKDMAVPYHLRAAVLDKVYKACPMLRNGNV